MKRLVLFVEGEGDVAAAPALISRILNDLPPSLQGHIFLDNPPFRVGSIDRFTGKSARKLHDYIRRAAQLPKLGAILVLLDGDSDFFEGREFCVVGAAKMLADRSRQMGAGSLFSFGVVFIRQEFESLLIAVATQLPGLKTDAILPSSVEDAPRDAKRWLRENLIDGYRSSTDQVLLTRAVTDWTPAHGLKSFQRLTHALAELAEAVQTGQHVISPVRPGE